MPKAKIVEIEQRIEAARLLILRGDEVSYICRNLMAAFGVSERTAERYIAAAREKINAIADVYKPLMLAEHLSVRRHIRTEAIKAGDLRAALAAAQDEAKLFDLYPASKAEISISWRDRIKAAGYDPDELFQSLITTARSRDVGIDSGGSGSSEAEDDSAAG